MATRLAPSFKAAQKKKKSSNLGTGPEDIEIKMEQPAAPPKKPLSVERRANEPQEPHFCCCCSIIKPDQKNLLVFKFFVGIFCVISVFITITQ